MTIEPGTKPGRWEICSKIGEGGLAEVYPALADARVINRTDARVFTPCSPNLKQRPAQSSKAERTPFVQMG